MNRASARLGRAGRRILSAAAVLVAAALAVAPAPAHAGEAQRSGSLIAAVYNATPFQLTYAGGKSQYGWNQAPTTVPPPSSRFVWSAALFDLRGGRVLPDDRGFFCLIGWTNDYNGWFTYRVTPPNSPPEYITISIRGPKRSDAGWCGGTIEPTVEVWHTSTPPPSGWAHYWGPPPNVLASPRFYVRHNKPHLFDQMVVFKG